METLSSEDREATFNVWWTKNVLPLCSPYDLQIVNQHMVKLGFFAAFPLLENLYDLSTRFREWNKNHPSHDQKAVEAFQAAGDMIRAMLDMAIKKESLCRFEPGLPHENL